MPFLQSDPAVEGRRRSGNSRREGVGEEGGARGGNVGRGRVPTFVPVFFFSPDRSFPLAFHGNLSIQRKWEMKRQTCNSIHNSTDLPPFPCRAKRTNFGKRREGTNKLAQKSAFPSLLLPTFFLSALSFSSPSSSLPLPIFDSSPPSFDG